MENRLRVVSIASFFLILIALCVFDVLNLDFGWQIKAGEYIWNTKSIPTRDVFSYIAEGSPWVDSHWLFQLVLYAAHGAGEMPGVVLLRISVLAATFALVISTSYRREYLPVSLVVCLLAVGSAYERFTIRPELFSFLFLAIFFHLTERFPDRRRLCFIALPICQALWANAHGLHALGVVFLGLYLVGDALQLFAARLARWIPPLEMGSRELKQKAGLFALVCAALLANANGIDGILYPYKIFGELREGLAPFHNVGELRSPFSMERSFPHPLAFYKAMLFVSAAAWFVRPRRIRLAHLLVYAAFLYLSVLGVRNVPLFSLVAAPITVHNLSGGLDLLLAKRRASRPAPLLVAIATASSMALLMGGTWAAAASNQLYRANGWIRSFGIGEFERVPSEFIAHLRQIEGNLFNSPEIGGFLIWKLYPHKRVAVDGRWEVYESVLPMVMGAYRSPDVFSELAEKHHITAVVLDRGSGVGQRMAPWLHRSREWKVAMLSREIVIFERANP